MSVLSRNALLRIVSRTRSRRPALWGKAGSVGALLALSATLGGCLTSHDSDPSVFITECLPNRADIVESVDWATVQTTRLRIVDGNFRPMIMTMEQNRPYILVLENADDKNHDFWAPDFLKTAIALDTIQFEGKAPGKGCVNGLRIKARTTVTLRFVPVWEGRYEVRDVNFALTPTIGPTAVMHVVPPRLGVAVN